MICLIFVNPLNVGCDEEGSGVAECCKAFVVVQKTTCALWSYEDIWRPNRRSQTYLSPKLCLIVSLMTSQAAKPRPFTFLFSPINYFLSTLTPYKSE